MVVVVAADVAVLRAWMSTLERTLARCLMFPLCIWLVFMLCLSTVSCNCLCFVSRPSPTVYEFPFISFSSTVSPESNATSLFTAPWKLDGLGRRRPVTRCRDVYVVTA